MADNDWEKSFHKKSGVNFFKTFYIRFSEKWLFVGKSISIIIQPLNPLLCAFQCPQNSIENILFFHSNLRVYPIHFLKRHLVAINPRDFSSFRPRKFKIWIQSHPKWLFIIYYVLTCEKKRYVGLIRILSICMFFSFFAFRPILRFPKVLWMYVLPVQSLDASHCSHLTQLLAILGQSD